jgi:hypothetical protein
MADAEKAKAEKIAAARKRVGLGTECRVVKTRSQYLRIG